MISSFFTSPSTGIEISILLTLLVILFIGILLLPSWQKKTKNKAVKKTIRGSRKGNIFFFTLILIEILGSLENIHFLAWRIWGILTILLFGVWGVQKILLFQKQKHQIQRAENRRNKKG